MTTGGKTRKHVKENNSGIDGRILDPLARRTAQRAAKAKQLATAPQSAPPSPTRTAHHEPEGGTPQPAEIEKVLVFFFIYLLLILS